MDFAIVCFLRYGSKRKTKKQVKETATLAYNAVYKKKKPSK
ncbi:hypothetical protein BIW11_02971 [Tropilaelaps mercedesae]|uniref:Uncharacterized protein n=1 Tax=Tropilaelaps mercedesae TaxID=418985 RepID=A0A1V9XU91_9ACAR|nr:hypothetical protein BIW11_02971 [Tropilaelaps mercedesae]